LYYADPPEDVVQALLQHQQLDFLMALQIDDCQLQLRGLRSGLASQPVGWLPEPLLHRQGRTWLIQDVLLGCPVVSQVPTIQRLTAAHCC
jgi:hypothetical protein